MEITSFILGVCAVIVLMMVVGTFMNYMSIKVLRKDINHLQKDIEYVRTELHEVEQNLNNYGENIERSCVKENENLYRHIDSRVDKVVDSLSREIANIYTELNNIEIPSAING
jgi:cell division protein FtsL